MFGKGVFSKCKIHGMRCPCSSPTLPSNDVGHPVRSAIAGTMCTPWSMVGSGQGFADPAPFSHLVWQEAAAREDFHVCTLENSEFFPVTVYKARFHDGYIIIYAVVCPSFWGWLVRRRRLFCTAVSLMHCVWLGPLLPADVTGAFMSFFRKRVVSSGDLFVNVGGKEVQLQHRSEMGKLRGIYGGSETAEVRDLLSPDAKRRFDKARPLATGEGACLVDISQNIEQRKRMGPWIGACTKSSQWMSLTADSAPTFVTASDIRAVHGWPQSVDSSFAATVPETFATLNFREHQHLCGNGMHLCALSAWLLFIHAHTVRREELQRYYPRQENHLIRGAGSAEPAEDEGIDHFEPS